MKKLLMVLSLSFVMILAVSAYAFADNNISLGYGFSGKTSSNGIDTDINGGLEIGYQYTFPQDQIVYGFGIDYQLDRALTNNTNQKFSSIPIYGVFKYNFSEGDTVPYLTARLGYSFMSANDALKNGGDIKGGIYYGLGFGVKFNQFNGELLYTVARSTYSIGGFNVDSDYKVLAVKFGYNF